MFEGVSGFLFPDEASEAEVEQVLYWAERFAESPALCMEAMNDPTCPPMVRDAAWFIASLNMAVGHIMRGVN